MKNKIFIIILFGKILFLTYCYKVYFNSPKSTPIPHAPQPDRKSEVNQPDKSEQIRKYHTARKKNMSVLFFTSDYCIPCKKMKKTVWPNPKVQKTVNRYRNSPWMLNSSEPDHVNMFHQYDIEYVPTTIIINNKKKEHKRYVGYMSVIELLIFLDGKK